MNIPTTIGIIIVAILLVLFILASLQLKAWHWCPTCRNYWSDEGDEQLHEPTSATGQIERCECARCAYFASLTQPTKNQS